MSLTPNCTIVNSTVARLPEHAHGTASSNSTSWESYDADGAMKFIIATVLVYSILGVFCTLLTRFKRERGRGHLNYVQDEMILKYVKTEKLLKIDGHRIKLMYNTQLMAERIRRYEEKCKLDNLEKDLDADFSVQNEELKSHHHKKQVRRKLSIGSTISKMGMSLLHVNTAQNPTNEDYQTDQVLATYSQKETSVNRPEPDVTETDDSCTEALIQSESGHHSFLETNI